MRNSEQTPRRVQVTSRQNRLLCQPEEIIRLCRFLDRQDDFAIAHGELSIAFLSEAEICCIHQQFTGDPTPTDVLTFPPDLAMDHAGEICLCVDVAMNRVGAAVRPLSLELTLYLLHGWLHLSGLDDRDPLSKKEMRTAESDLLERVGDAGLLPVFEWLPAQS